VPRRSASIIALNECDDSVAEVVSTSERRRDILVDGLGRCGWEIDRPSAIPREYAEMGSLSFALQLLDQAHVAVSPGVGFGPSGDGHVRFALVENDQRIAQAVRGIRKALDRL